MRWLVRTALALVLALTGIPAAAEAQDRPKPRPDRNRVDVEELRGAPSTTVYEFVRARRARWLSTRGQTALGTRTTTNMRGDQSEPVAIAPEVVVYVDHAKYGNQDALKVLSTDDVDSMEYLDSSSATQRFGTGHPHGAIVIRSRVR